MNSNNLEAMYICLRGWHSSPFRSKLARKQKKRLSMLIYKLEKQLGEINIINFRTKYEKFAIN